MANPQEKLHVFDKPQNVQRVLWALYVGCAILFLADFILHRHGKHPWEDFPGFYALYGFIGCSVLVIAAKGLRKLVMRSEDYYGD